MKRTALITLGVILTAGAVFAAGGYGQGYGPGYGMGAGMGGGMGGFGPGNCPMYGANANGKGVVTPRDPNFKPVTKDQAQKSVEAYMAANLKGYKIDKTQEFQGRRFTMYNFFVKDASGNTFILRVNPMGYVMGPMVAQQQ